MRLPRAGLCLALFLCAGIGSAPAASPGPLRIGVVDIDATPPVGSPLAYDTMERKNGSLRLKGVVLTGAGEPIVLVAVDWIGIGGEGYSLFRESLAKAVGTPVERVALHCLHQHDAPRFDMSAERLLAEQGLSGKMFNVLAARDVITRASEAARQATERGQPVTHIGLGKAKVNQVASNRRILGDDGKVKHTRWTTTRDAAIRAFPEGVIDPYLRAITFYNGDQPLATLTYYATHPQSFYRTKAADPDFPGLARDAMQQQTGTPHIHFNGASGNVGAGKYNDGSRENRPRLVQRMQAGMTAAEENIERHAIAAKDVGWAVETVQLPAADHLDEAALKARLEDVSADTTQRIYDAKALAFLRRCQAGEQTEISCLRLGPARVLHMPGELFVEYQLQAAQLRPQLFVAMAAYGDYAPGYIGTEVAYTQGGYETSDRASRVAPEVEGILMGAVKKLLAE